jgi:hypothetical protein
MTDIMATDTTTYQVLSTPVDWSPGGFLDEHLAFRDKERNVLRGRISPWNSQFQEILFFSLESTSHDAANFSDCCHKL